MSSTDFQIKHLRGQALRAAKLIRAHLTGKLERAPSGGGCKAFYSPKQWKERGEEYGTNSVLVLVHDGGDLSPFCNYDYGCPGLVEGLRLVLEKEGLYIECCTGWYSAVYPS